MADTQPQLKSVPAPEIRSKKQTKKPIDPQRLAMLFAFLLAVFGGGSYVVNPWATGGQQQSIEDKLTHEITERKGADALVAQQLYNISLKLHAEIVPGLLELGDPKNLSNSNPSSAPTVPAPN